MAEFFRYEDFCFCPHGGLLPEGAVAVSKPFTPLVFLVSREPKTSRGFFAIHSIAELDEPEGVGLLLPPAQEQQTDELSDFVRLHGASVVNTAFSRWLNVLSAYFALITKRPRVNLVGLGNVGGTTALGLKLLGTGLTEIGIYDRDKKQCLRYEAELNQVLPVREDEPLPQIRVVTEDELFRCDALLFTAARAVPEVGAESGGDVRMMQYEANRALLKDYAKRARESEFCGVFCQISDPVDQLSRAMFLMSNTNEEGEFDGAGLLPEQVRGFGLGVMRARALYYAQKEGIDASALCAYGPHGGGLVVANAPDERYDDALSLRLTQLAREANLRLREIGVKPYIAPGLSSAAISILRALDGDWHDSAVPLGGAYFGCRARLGEHGPETLRQPLNERLFLRIAESWKDLRRLDETWAD